MVSILRGLRDRRKIARRVKEEVGFAVERYGDKAADRIAEQLRNPNMTIERKRFLAAVLRALQKG
jgi:hypothetical protein